MKISKPIIKHFFLFLGIYFVLLICVNFGGGKEQFANFFRSSSSVFYQSFGDGGAVEIKPSKKDKLFDTVCILTSKHQKNKALAEARAKGLKKTKITPVKFPLNTWNMAGLSFLFFISLIFATPVDWKTKLKSLLIGFVLLYAFMMAKMGVSLLLKFSIYYERFGVGFENKYMLEAINYLNNIIGIPFVSLILAALIWLFLCFKKVSLKPKPTSVEEETVVETATVS